MQQPQTSKLKVRAQSQASAPATLRERFEAETRRNASRSKDPRNGVSNSQRVSSATATPNGFLTLLKGLFIIGALAAALYFAAAIPNRFGYLAPYKEKIDQVIGSTTQPVIATTADTSDAIKLDTVETQTIAEVSEPTVETAEIIPEASEVIEITLEPIAEPSEAIVATSERIQELATPALTEVEISASQKPAISQSVTTPAVGITDGMLYRVQTYRARMFSHPSSTTATETPIEHNNELTVLGREGDWVQVKVKNSGLIGFIHITQITG